MPRKKPKINDRPFLLSGYTYSEYVRWCNFNKLISYKKSSKQEFFRRINEGELIKLHGKMYDNKKEIKVYAKSNH